MEINSTGMLRFTKTQTATLQEKITQFQNIKQYPSSFYSAFLFLTNVVSAIYFGQTMYALLFLNLFITSLIVHSDNTNIKNTIDKFAILYIVLFGGRLFMKRFNEYDSKFKILIPVSALLVFFLYYIGYYIKQFCFDTDREIGNLYHSLLHAVSSIGHHMILWC
jgi:hypothetical protein